MAFFEKWNLDFQNVVIKKKKCYPNKSGSVPVNVVVKTTLKSFSQFQQRVNLFLQKSLTSLFWLSEIGTWRFLVFYEEYCFIWECLDWDRRKKVYLETETVTFKIFSYTLCAQESPYISSLASLLCLILSGYVYVANSMVRIICLKSNSRN